MLQSETETWIHADREWVHDAQASGVLCRRCRRVLPTRRGDLPLVRLSQVLALHAVGGVCGAAIVRRDVWELLRSLVPVGTHVVLVVAQRPFFSDHVAVVLPASVRTRGYPPVTMSLCECGSVFRNSQIKRPDYLLRNQTQNAGVIQSDSGWCYIRSDHVKRFRGIPDLELAEHAVLDVPRDGLRYPGDPPEWPGVTVEEWLQAQPRKQ
jgi:hypothetical protein